MAPSSKTILLVEDDPVVLALYSRLLDSQGFRVETAGDGLEALKRIAELRPDLVVLDLLLPKLNGSDVVKFIRGKPELRSTPVIVLSNLLFSEVAREAARAGADRGFSKAECRPRELIAAVRELLGDDLPDPAEPSNAGIESAADPDRECEAAQEQQAEEIIEQLVSRAPSEELALQRQEPSAAPAQDPAPADESEQEVLVREAQACFLEEALDAAVRVRKDFQTFIRSPESPDGRTSIEALCKEIELLSAGAERTLCTRIALLTNAFQHALADIRYRPGSLAPPLLRTLTQAVDCLRNQLETFQPGAGTLAKPATALIVEDDRVCSRVVISTLKNSNIEAVAAERPEIAMRLARDNHYDIIFLDIDLPGINGLELCRWLRLLPHHAKTPVIFVTASTDFQSRAESVTSGGNAFISKPICASELSLKAIIHLLQDPAAP